MAEITVESDVQIADADVAGVLLADGWHPVESGSFTTGESWQHVEEGRSTLRGWWFGFDERRRTAQISAQPTRRVVGPVSSILALRS